LIPPPTAASPQAEDAPLVPDMLVLAETDVDFAYCEITAVLYTITLGVNLAYYKQKGNEPQTREMVQCLKDIGARWSKEGIVEQYCLRSLAAFAQLPNPADANANFSMSMFLLQKLVYWDGSRGEGVLARIADTFDMEKRQRAGVGGIATSFDRICEGCIFALSGFQNPLRDTIRTEAIAMGAQYSSNWEVGPHSRVLSFSGRLNQQEGTRC
jgi:hypothetical protein